MYLEDLSFHIPQKVVSSAQFGKKMSSVALLIAEIAKIALFDKSVQKGQNRGRSYFGLWDGL